MSHKDDAPVGVSNAVGVGNDDWLAVSLEGFAAMNAGRDPAHLVKELVQNALDALGQAGGEILLNCHAGRRKGTVEISCWDSGCGMQNLADIRTVFWTSKTDSPLHRGRMGRGFKEMLCLALCASVTSGRRKLDFCLEGERRFTRESQLPNHRFIAGTLVEMTMSWEPKVIEHLEAYFQTLLVPTAVRLVVNGEVIAYRPATHTIEAMLPTELYEQGRWVRPGRKTSLELVAVQEGEEAMVYELGIPVCPADWTVPYHACVLQRVPMNPYRDAVASGYLVKLHRACLPTLLPELSGEQVRQDWVGSAVPHCDEDIQKEVIQRGFGDNIARSVPKMGARQFDEDAREIGTAVIDTRQTSGGFRQILQDHVPTTREVVEGHNRRLVQAAAAGCFAVKDVYAGQDDVSARRRKLIESVGGKERVEQVMDFARWFCQKLLDGYEGSAVCSVTLALLKDVNAVATWSSDDVLTLGIDTPWLWTDPLGEETLSVLVHEGAHSRNAHHGQDFHTELEKLAGRAARIMFIWSGYIQKEYATLLGTVGP